MSNAENMALTTPAARLFPGLMSDNPAIVANAEIELERLCEAGDPNAQRGALVLVYENWRVGRITYDDYAWRIAHIVRLAVATDTLRAVFIYEGDGPPVPWLVDHGQLAEFVCVLDMMADTGDVAGMVALGKVSDILPAEALDLGRRLRFLPAGRPCSVGAHDPFADLTPLANEPIVEPPPLERFDSISRPLSRWERLRWWVLSCWWSPRFRFDDACWSARLAWCRVADAVRAWWEGH